MGCSEVWGSQRRIQRLSNACPAGNRETYGDQVLVCLVTSDLVQLLVELRELGGLCHLLSKHELWGLERCVVFVGQELEAVVNDSPGKLCQCLTEDQGLGGHTGSGRRPTSSGSIRGGRQP